MAITKMTLPTGKDEFTVYVNIRSKKMPHIRFQKRLRGIESNAEALRSEKKIIQDLSHKVALEEGHGLSWKMIIMKWATTVACSTYVEKSYNPTTVKDYVSMLHRWTSSWLNKSANQITRGDGRDVLEQVIKDGKSKAFQKRLKNTINMIFNWAIEYKFVKGINHSPVYGMKIVVKQDRRPEILKPHEIRKLLYEAKAQSHEWYHVWALALLTGMRNGELYSLRWEDIDFDASIIKVERSYNFKADAYKDTKAGYWRSVPISNELRLLLLEIKIASKSNYVLPHFQSWKGGEQAKILKIFCRSIGLKEIKFHTLRACFATQLIGSGVEPVKVMKICGWKELKTLAVYLRLAGIDEKGATEGLNFLPFDRSNILSINTVP